MVVRFVLWNLADSKTNIEELRRALADGELSPAAPGLEYQAWLSDESTERFGAVFVWSSPEAAEQPLPHGARGLIGIDPVIAELFEVEATFEA